MQSEKPTPCISPVAIVIILYSNEIKHAMHFDSFISKLNKRVRAHAAESHRHGKCINKITRKFSYLSAFLQISCWFQRSQMKFMNHVTGGMSKCGPKWTHTHIHITNRNIDNQYRKNEQIASAYGNNVVAKNLHTMHWAHGTLSTVFFPSLSPSISTF